MKSDQFNNRVERLLRTSRSFEQSHGFSDSSSPRRMAIMIGVMGVVLFFFLFFILSSEIGDTTASVGARRFFVGFILVFFQLVPCVIFALVFFSAAGNVCGTWISTHRTLFHIKPDGGYDAMDWKDVRSIEKKGSNLFFRGRHRCVAVPIYRTNQNPANVWEYIWFLNRLIEDYGRERQGAESLHKLREKIICPLLYRFTKKSPATLFFVILFAVLPVLIFSAGLPFFYAQLEAGRDPQQMILALQLGGILPMLSPFLMLIPLAWRHPYVKKQAIELYWRDVLPRLNEPLRRVSWSDYEKWQFGRRRGFTRFQSDETVEQFLAMIPPPPRSISPSVRRRFLIPGGTILFTAFLAGLIALFTGFFLLKGTEHSIREAQFWNWSPAGMGTIIRIEPEYKTRDGNTSHVYDRLEFSRKNSDGTETRHVDTRGFKIGSHKIGQNVAVQAFRGDERFLRIESKSWKDQSDSSTLIFILVPACVGYFILLLVIGISCWSDGKKKIRYWERSTTGWGKVIDATCKGTTIRLVEPEGESKTIFCPGVVYLGRENLWRPLAVFIAPENPAEGTTIQPLPFGLRIDPESKELAVDAKTLWVWPFVGSLILLAFILSIFAVFKFFAV